MVSWLDAAIREHRSFELGELRVDLAADGWNVCGPRTTGESAERCIETSDSEALRRHVQFDDAGRYRPLTGARSLPGGWHVQAADDTSLRTVLDVVYPLATHHITQEAAGSLWVVELEVVLERQSGRYANADRLRRSGPLAGGTGRRLRAVRSRAGLDRHRPGRRTGNER